MNYVRLNAIASLLQYRLSNCSRQGLSTSIMFRVMISSRLAFDRWRRR